MTNQPYYQELFLAYTHLIRLPEIVDIIEEVLAILVEHDALDDEVQQTTDSEAKLGFSYYGKP
jgi:hypothetical protein